MTTPVGAGARPDGPHGPARWWPVVLGALAVATAATLLLPWWRSAGAVLAGAGPLRALPPEVRTGAQVAGVLRTALVVLLASAAAVVAVVDLRDRGRLGTRVCAAAAGAAGAACGVAALVERGATGPLGAWLAAAGGLAVVGLAVAGGLAAVGLAAGPGAGGPGRGPPARLPGRARVPLVLGAALLAAAGTAALPAEDATPGRATVGPFRPVAALAGWSRDDGAAALPGPDDVRPVLVAGAPGVVGPTGVVVADARGRARVVVRTAPGGPPPLGVAAGRMVRWVAADALAVTGLRADGPLEVVVRDVAAASPLGDDGVVWLRSDLDPSDTVRRLDTRVYPGRQDLSATFLPVVTIQRPAGEGPVDVAAVLPVPGGALRAGYERGERRIELLTETSAGIVVRPVAVPRERLCGALVGGFDEPRVLAADATGVWFPTTDRRVAHVDRAGVVRRVEAGLPGRIDALAAPGDGSVLLVTAGATADEAHTLWRLPDATAALAAAPAC